MAGVRAAESGDVAGAVRGRLHGGTPCRTAGGGRGRGAAGGGGAACGGAARAGGAARGGATRAGGAAGASGAGHRAPQAPRARARRTTRIRLEDMAPSSVMRPSLATGNGRGHPHEEAAARSPAQVNSSVPDREPPAPTCTSRCAGARPLARGVRRFPGGRESTHRRPDRHGGNAFSWSARSGRLARCRNPSFPTAVLLSFVAGLSGAGLAACGSGGPKPTATPSEAPSGAPSGSPSGAPSAGVNASRDAYSPDKRAFVCGCLGPRLGVASSTECTREVTAKYGVVRAGCYRAHKSDCQDYIECVYMEPPRGPRSVWPTESHVPSTCATCRCAVPCGPGKPACAKGKECLDTADGNKACL